MSQHETEPLAQARPMRPQYHFFYGSTDDNQSRSTTVDHDIRSSINEQESLLGENLVPTDNEEEPPVNNSDFDLQHVLISNGSGSMRHVVGGGNPSNNGTNGKSYNHHANGTNGDKLNGDYDDGNIHNSLTQFRATHPVVHIVGLVGCMTLCMVIFAVTLFPSANTATATSLGMPAEAMRKFVMKFPTVDRSKSNDAAKLFLKKDLFHPDLHYNGQDPLRMFVFPFPTGAFWTNLVLPATADRGFSYPIAVYPYAYKWSPTALIASYPSLHRKEDAKAIHDYFIPDLTFSVKEEVQQRYITNFDPLSVTLQFQTTASSTSSSSSSSSSASVLGQGSWQTFLVQGSPYTTLEYNDVTPQIRALSTFKNVGCPGEESGGGFTDDEFDDNFLQDDDDDDGRRRTRRRKLLGVCGASTDSNGNGLTTLRGVQFVLQTQEGVNWIIFASEPISFVYNTRIRTTVVSNKPFKGTLRLAIIPPSSKVEDFGSGMVQVTSSTGLRRLVYHASIYPVGAKVDYAFRDPAKPATPTTSIGKKVVDGITGGVSVLKPAARKIQTPTKGEGRVADVHFHFITKVANSNANAANAAIGKNTGLLMLSLPHHAFSFTKSHILDANHFDLVYQCIKGAMTPVVGDHWTYEEKLLTLGFEPSAEDTSKDLDSVLSNRGVRALLADNLEIDVNIAPPTREENVYGFGKQVARLAQLAHIADKLLGPDNPAIPTDSANATSSSSARSGSDKSIGSSSSRRSKAGNSLDDRLKAVRQKAMAKLSVNLDRMFTDQQADSLLYDPSLGGIVSSDGLADFNADFGNGRYNDHHFHYGYLLYASAIMGKLNATFVNQHGDRVDALMHDIAYNSNIKDGSFFPLARHMSWFDGHSFASGLFQMANGKSQESSSEAVNCYYGAYLWTLVRSGSANKPSADTSTMTDFARLLLAMEVRGAKTYWHMMPPSSSSSSSSGISNSTTTIVSTAWPTVYSPQFAKNYMVGVLGMFDAVCSTWFGTENLYVHMINFLPVTAVTRYLFNTEYATKEYANVISAYPNAEMAWRGYVVSDHALVSPMKAWKEALKLKSAQLDAGLSKTQALYFILTSPLGFDLSALPRASSSSNGGSGSSSIPGDATDSATGTESGSSPSGSSSSAAEDADCASHQACAATGLTGLCCPTSGGNDLFCCHS